MRKIFTLALFICLGSFCKAQFVTIPDAGFRNFLMTRYPACFNAANEMDTTCAAITNEDSLTVQGWDLTGIGYFDNLVYLHAPGAFVGGIHLPATLKYLNINWGNASGILFPPTLEWLDLSYSSDFINTEVPQNYFPNSLQYLNLEGMEMYSSTTPITWPTSLRYINLAYNRLAHSGYFPPSLDTLIIHDQMVDDRMVLTIAPALTDLHIPSNLVYLNCKNNSLSSLGLPSTLTWLDCSGNWRYVLGCCADYRIPSLRNLGTMLPPGLEYLKCDRNALSALPPLPPTLKYLDCSENRFEFHVYDTPSSYSVVESVGISNLGDLPPTLQHLNVGSNHLLDTLYPLPATLRSLQLGATAVEHLPALPHSLNYLDLTNTGIRCIPELPMSMGSNDPSGPWPYNLLESEFIECLPNLVPGLKTAFRWEVGQTPSARPNRPVCTVLNNPNGCSFSPVATGFVFYDNNNNGIHDAGELPRQGVKVSVDRGETGFTDLEGKYAVACAQGANVLSVTPPPFYNALPAVVNYTLNAGDTLINETIALQANTSADSISIKLIPLGTPRPGFDYGYQVKFENVGTTTLNASINIAYNNGQLSYLSSSNAAVTHSPGALSLPLSTFSPGSRGEFTVHFTVLASLGDNVITFGTANTTTIIGSDSSVNIVTGSFDPNDKLATQQLSPADVSAGRFIDYIVRFQNTGTDTAFRVNITDTLSNLLQYESFEMVEASHACKTIIDSIYVSFEFENILLPDSNVNEPASHGFVRFRIKPVSTLVLDDEVHNKASIYFDYNIPVVTNNAVTKVAVSVPVPQYSLLNFSGSLQPQNMVRLEWSTENEQQVNRFIVLESLDGTNRYPVDTIDAIGGTGAGYSVTLPIAVGTTYYWLQTENNNGVSLYSNRISFTVTGPTDPTDPPLTTTVRNNPVRGTLYLDVADAALLNTIAVLINSEGRIVKRFLINAESMIVNVADLSAGVYYLKTKTAVKRLIIMR